MINFEKYKEYILKWDDEFTIDERDNEPKRCTGDICPHCYFYQHYSDVGCGSARIRWLYEEYAEPTVDWSKVPIDTKVLVSINGESWHRRYFAGVNDGKPTVWYNGRTSWSVALEDDYKAFSYIKLEEVRD